jgi:hypothetical protein
MNKKAKMNLTDLKVQSFVTDVTAESNGVAKGGEIYPGTYPSILVTCGPRGCSLVNCSYVQCDPTDVSVGTVGV